MQDGVLTDIGQAYAAATSGWLGALLPIAQQLFVLLATLEIAWSGIGWALAARSDEIVLARLLRKVMTLLFFYMLLLFAPNWIPSIVGSFVRAGQEASGFRSLEPSAVIDQGIDVALGMFDSLSGFMAFLNAPLWLYFAPVVVILSFTVIAGTLLIALIESYIVLGGGVLLLGFAGSRWTVSVAEAYLLYAVRVGIKLFVIYLLIGLGMQLPEVWLQRLANDGSGSMRDCFQVMAGSLIFAMILLQVPRLAAAMVGPRPGFNLERAFGEGR